MATIEDRPFSKDYSGLINQSVIAGVIFAVCITSQELMKRKRRGKVQGDALGSVESWQFGYLYQGRSWARRPSPPSPKGWPLSWVKQALSFPEERLNYLRGVDATLYARFLRGCFWFSLLHTFTTAPILLPIHIEFSEGSISPKSMVRASISALVETAEGKSLLWIHLVLIIWVTLTWMLILCWLCRGAFLLREQKIATMAANGSSSAPQQDRSSTGNQSSDTHRPDYSMPALGGDEANRGLRLRTVMVTNIPPLLRSDKDLKEYFEYYLSRRVAKPAWGLTIVQPGFANKVSAYLLNHLRPAKAALQGQEAEADQKDSTAPLIDRVVMVRRMTELASLLERREEILRLLETAHIKLAKKIGKAVKDHMARSTGPASGPLRRAGSTLPLLSKGRKRFSWNRDLEQTQADVAENGESRMDLLIRTIGHFIYRQENSKEPEPTARGQTIWEALLSLPRSTLDVYQPLIHLSALFRGKTVPAIDYYTAKLDVLTSLITEKRSKAVSDYDAMSTAFVTFTDPADARRACKYLAVHPGNPLVCFVTMAPSYEDLDWIRVMKPTFRVEFVKDWVVNLGVWGFTIFWIFPVSLFVGLVSIQSISAVWPGLSNYLEYHEWEEELLQSFVPTVLVALLSMLVPLLLLLIGKKAHTIATLSVLHDRILTRYYKFLVCNVLVFFCIGTAAVQSLLVSVSHTSGLQLIQIVAESFPTAGPFYVGWLIFTMALHGGLELALFGLPLLVYPTTQRQVTPRKRAKGLRPRTFNYYYWLPNHILVIYVLLLFAVLNPLVLPFGMIYFAIEAIVVKNQFIHVYAKNYEGEGRILLIRMVRYTLDGLLLAQIVFLAYMVVLKKTTNVAVSVVVIVFTVIVKWSLTQVIRAKYENIDALEAQVACGKVPSSSDLANSGSAPDDSLALSSAPSTSDKPAVSDLVGAPNTVHWTMRFADRLTATYRTLPGHFQQAAVRKPIPFRSMRLDTSQERLRPSMAVVLSESPIEEFPKQPDFPVPPHVDADVDMPRQLPVTPHPPHTRWEDEPSLDRSYDNPYYTCEVEDVLWLPRDPFGPLNLDDTVDMRVALTSQPASGSLGMWRQDELITSNVSLATSLGGDFTDIDYDDTLSFTSTLGRLGLDGSENIDLPPVIAHRVDTRAREEDIETAVPLTRLSSRRSRRPSAASTTRVGQITLRRPSTLADSSHRFRSFSLNNDVPTPRHANSLPLPSERGAGRQLSTHSDTLDYELRPPRSRIHDGSHVTLPSSTDQSRGAASYISTREAVVGEVIMEEVVEARTLMREEEAEVVRAQEPGSWFTRWMFAKEPKATS